MKSSVKQRAVLVSILAATVTLGSPGVSPVIPFQVTYAITGAGALVIALYFWRSGSSVELPRQSALD